MFKRKRATASKEEEKGSSLDKARDQNRQYLDKDHILQ